MRRDKPSEQNDAADADRFVVPEEHRAAVLEGLRQAERSEFASEEEMAAGVVAVLRVVSMSGEDLLSIEPATAIHFRERLGQISRNRDPRILRRSRTGGDRSARGDGRLRRRRRRHGLGG